MTQLAEDGFGRSAQLLFFFFKFCICDDRVYGNKYVIHVCFTLCQNIHASYY